MNVFSEVNVQVHFEWEIMMGIKLVNILLLWCSQVHCGMHSSCNLCVDGI